MNGAGVNGAERIEHFADGDPQKTFIGLGAPRIAGAQFAVGVGMP